MLGCALSAVGFYLWGAQLGELDFGTQWYALAMAGAGLGLVLGPVSTDALNRAARGSYGEVTGITQTVRNLGASLGLAVMGSLFITENVTRVQHTLSAHGVSPERAHQLAHAITAGSGGNAAGSAPPAILDAVRLDFAHSSQTIAWIMAGIMAAAFIVAKLGLESGRSEATVAAAPAVAGARSS
jgi:hypothetical protein